MSTLVDIIMVAIASPAAGATAATDSLCEDGKCSVIGSLFFYSNAALVRFKYLCIEG